MYAVLHCIIHGVDISSSYNRGSPSLRGGSPPPPASAALLLGSACFILKAIIRHRSSSFRERRPKTHPVMRARLAHTEMLTHRVRGGVRHRISAFPRQLPSKQAGLHSAGWQRHRRRTLAVMAFRISEIRVHKLRRYICVQTFTFKASNPHRDICNYAA